MNKQYYEGSGQYRPITAWGYVGYSILFCIPVIGWIIWIVFMFSSKNINRRSYARSFFCRILLGLIFAVAFAALVHFNIGGLRTIARQWNNPYYNELIEQFDALMPNTSVPKNPIQDTASASSGDVAGVRKDVKDAIDGYEAFFKEYVDFMKEYSKSSNPMSMMEDYTKMLAKYSDMMEQWEQFDKEYTMNDAELKYYADVTTRINKTLLDVMK